MINQNWIKTYVIQILPALALIVYIIGFAYNLVYYYQFGINITSYITLSEVLISTLAPILIVVILSASFFTGQLLLRFPQKMIYKDLIKLWLSLKEVAIIKNFLVVSQPLISNLKSKKKRFKKKEENFEYQYLYTIPFSISIISVIIPLCIYVDIIKVQYKYLLSIGLVLFSFFSVELYIRKYKSIKFRIVKYYYNLNAIIVLLISTLIGVLFIGYYNAERDKQYSELIFKIYTIDGFIYTEQDYNYVGECNAAVFLYNKKDNNTLILYSTNLSKVIYYNKRSSTYMNVIKDIEKFNEEFQH